MIDMFEFSNTSQFSTDPVGQPSTTNLEFAITWQSALGGDVFHDEQLDINEGDTVKLDWSGGHNVYRAEGDCGSYLTKAAFQSAPTYTAIESEYHIGIENPYTLESPSGAPATYCYACISHWGSMRFTLRINQFQPESGQPATQQSGQPAAEPTTQQSGQPTAEPTPAPTPSAYPTPTPPPGDWQQTSEPTPPPTREATTQPTDHVTAEPSHRATEEPNAEHTKQPTGQQTSEPTTQPPGQFSSEPIGRPSTQPVGQPS